MQPAANAVAPQAAALHSHKGALKPVMKKTVILNCALKQINIFSPQANLKEVQ